MKKIIFIFLFSPLLTTAADQSNKEQEQRKTFCKSLASRINSRLYDFYPIVFSDEPDTIYTTKYKKGYNCFSCNSSASYHPFDMYHSYLFRKKLNALDTFQKSMVKCADYIPAELSKIEKEQADLKKCVDMRMQAYKSQKEKNKQDQEVDRYINSFKKSS